MELIIKLLSFFNLTINDVVTVGKQLFWVLVGAGFDFLSKYFSGHDFGTGGTIVGILLALLARKSIDTPVKKSLGMKI